MHLVLSLQSLLFGFSLFELISADCRCFGTDYVDGGGPYCVNTTSTDYFSFGTRFEGCTKNDTQGGVTPILIDPDSDEFFCSDIQTNPDDVTMISTCNVPGNVVEKANMTSGEWIVVIEGLDFAWMRSFSIDAGPPATYTSTPTATFSITSTPTVTSTSTSTVVSVTTLQAQTVTVPSTTRTITKTITPRPVTTTISSLLTITKHRYVFSTTVETVTSTLPCPATVGPWDPICTIRPRLAKFAAATLEIHARRSDRLQRDPAWAREVRHEAERRGLIAARTIDQCSTTVIATTNLPSTTVTITASTSTLTMTTDITTTSTQTPAVVTTLSGKAWTTTTITAPTRTITRISRGLTTTIVTNTVWATITTTTDIHAAGPSCPTLSPPALPSLPISISLSSSKSSSQPSWLGSLTSRLMSLRRRVLGNADDVNE